MKALHYEKLQQAAQMLKSVAHPVRIGIINLLVEKGEMSVTELQMKLKISQSMTSQHLKSLKSAGVVKCRKNANVCNYYISNRNVLKLLACVENTVNGKGAVS